MVHKKERIHTEKQVVNTFPEPWKDDSIQFPRLIAEAEAAGLFADNNKLDTLCGEMDLLPEEIMEIVDRAQLKWAKIVRDLPNRGTKSCR